ncbi:hypothetical protein AMAG_18647 [Allomyces macrogynus ATCC 38327]|uniref:Peptidase M48 domain-containing protein n=1 Tax=Allomyces macrogynus (strain ATCC 38327) TaxID=578462 RepID=A0A0L0SGC7_ALLM3|nr:hypothetical protein AMAG_18647 [Allomyces macrogynus ATCC 38327]|eukprot:KNE61563.1 hypothetical protein AMAG_18647 [Allomyces macrogynus ATCC 38327]
MLHLAASCAARMGTGRATLAAASRSPAGWTSTRSALLETMPSRTLYMSPSRQNPALRSARSPLCRTPSGAIVPRRNLAFTNIFVRIGLILAKTHIFDRFRPKDGPWYKDWRIIATGLIIGGSGAYYVSHLEEVPFSHRMRFISLSPEAEAKISEAAYQEIIVQYWPRLLKIDHPIMNVVHKVATDIITAADLADKADWAVHVVDAPEIPNALVLPGGKIFVFTGILPICKDEDGLAIVLSHEIAHQLARHTAEKLSLENILTYMRLGFAFFFDLAILDVSAYLTKLGIELPFSREMEHEADHIGLLLAARACYNPAKAVEFWERMAALEAKNTDDSEEDVVPMQFFSTHPATLERIERIQAQLEEAEAHRPETTCDQLQDELKRPNGMAAWIKRAVDRARGKAKHDVEVLFRLEPADATAPRRSLAFTKISVRAKRGPWYKNWRFIATGFVIGGLGAYYVSHLNEVPISRRRRFISLPSEAEAKVAEAAYKEMTEEYWSRLLKDDHPIAQVVHKVASDIINAAELADKADWTIHVVDAPEMPTAFVLPGGKIFVFTGILPICEDEDGLAVVLGHEIAHQLARHTAEQLAIENILMSLGLAFLFDLTVPDAYFARKMEHEADHIGLFLTARACYDPAKAVEFWERFAFIEDLFADDEEPLVMQFWRTHPVTTERIERIQARLEEAEAHCAETSCHLLKDEVDRPNEMGAWIKRVVDRARGKAKHDVEVLFRLDPVEFD